MNHQDPETNKLDRELDAALAKFATVEPRTGLEERVLANLRAEHAAEHSWGRWPVLGATAAVVIVVAVSLLWQPGEPTPDITTHLPATTVQGDKQTGMHIAAKDMGTLDHPAVPTAIKRPTRPGVRHPQALVASGPRLDQFPSPRPLSEEEKLLVRYVQDFPHEAVIIAKEQAELEQEMERLDGGQPPRTNSDQQER
ncbi:MAG: hypothetical protein WCA20_22500 [Candidatus Sulfotelmatobacter sp.]